ncbi:MAG: hypothetical protein AAF585_04855, partial [Verrucomicrobiota bacterium]
MLAENLRAKRRQFRVVFLQLLSLLFLATPFTSSAQSDKTEHTLALDEGNTSPEAKIQQIEWIAGHWHGE